ncbi:MAG: hypothetical protein ACJAT4_000494 [Granulosicoccus sp.]|jgi:hypothetical protein
MRLGIYEMKFSSNRPNEIDCYHCGVKNQIIINGIVKGINLFFLPLFPYKIRQEVQSLITKGVEKIEELNIDYLNIEKYHRVTE